jgi:ketosteroid isomerase-like protein
VSRADFELVQRAWEAGTQGIQALLPYCDPDIEVIPFGAAMEGRSYRGHAALRDWWEQEIEPNWETFQTHAEDYEQVGERLVVFGRWVARGRNSGIDLEIPATWVVEVKDGKIARWQTYTERAEALRAARQT